MAQSQQPVGNITLSTTQPPLEWLLIDVRSEVANRLL